MCLAIHHFEISGSGLVIHHDERWSTMLCSEIARVFGYICVSKTCESRGKERTTQIGILDNFHNYNNPPS